MVAARFLSLASLEERALRTREELRGSIKTDITPGGEESLGGGNSPRGYISGGDPSLAENIQQRTPREIPW